MFCPSVAGPAINDCRHLLWHLLTSGHLFQCFSAPIAAHAADHQSSQGKTRDLCTYARRIYSNTFRTSIGLRRFWTSYPVLLPRMRFLFVRPVFCRECIHIRRLSSDSTSRWTPLPSANRSPCRVGSGLSPPSLSATTTCTETAPVKAPRAMPGAPKKNPYIAQGFSCCSDLSSWKYWESAGEDISSVRASPIAFTEQSAKADPATWSLTWLLNQPGTIP
jgi:hypothetical protein